MLRHDDLDLKILFLEIRFECLNRTPIVTLLLCHYKKEVVATLEVDLYQQSRIVLGF